MTREVKPPVAGTFVETVGGYAGSIRFAGARACGGLRYPAGRLFEKTVPSVLIQDPIRKCAYLIPAADLQKYRVEENTTQEYGIAYLIPPVPERS